MSLRRISFKANEKAFKCLKCEEKLLPNIEVGEMQVTMRCACGNKQRVKVNKKTVDVIQMEYYESLKRSNVI